MHRFIVPKQSAVAAQAAPRVEQVSCTTRLHRSAAWRCRAESEQRALPARCIACHGLLQAGQACSAPSSAPPALLHCLASTLLPRQCGRRQLPCGSRQQLWLLLPSSGQRSSSSCPGLAASPSNGHRHACHQAAAILLPAVGSSLLVAALAACAGGLRHVNKAQHCVDHHHEPSSGHKCHDANETARGA